jgi:signal peptidase I
MFDKWRRYSYAAQKHQRYRLLKILLCFLALYVLYNVLIAYGFSVWSVGNDTMREGLHPGDMLIFASYKLPDLISDLKSDGRDIPHKRGDIVLLDAPAGNYSVFMKALDGIVRFFTAQQFGISGRNQVYIKRIIGLPGDKISMANYIFRVKSVHDSFTLTEFEMAPKPYYPVIPAVSPLWDESIPFSGSMKEVTLRPDEYFVVSDDRSNTNDSRTWGALPSDAIMAKAVFRFWPLTRIGRP